MACIDPIAKTPDWFYPTLLSAVIVGWQVWQTIQPSALPVEVAKQVALKHVEPLSDSSPGLLEQVASKTASIAWSALGYVALLGIGAAGGAYLAKRYWNQSSGSINNINVHIHNTPPQTKSDPVVPPVTVSAAS